MNSVLGSRRTALLLVGPALLVYSAITLLPIVWSFGYTFFSGGLIQGFTFAGLKNFQTFFTDPNAWNALLFTARYAIIVTIGQVVIGYLLALMYVFFLRRASSFVRTVVFFPVVLPTVAVSLLFQRMFQLTPQPGPANALVQAFGGTGTDFLGHADSAFWVLIVMDIWRSMGFYAVLLFAGLVDIPDEIIESARMDGARGWSLLRGIILPMSLPILFASFIFSINGTIKVFDSVFALTAGGPGTSTQPLTLYMYRTAFQYSDYGYGSTIALLLTIMCLVVTLLIFRASRRDNTV